MIQQKFCATCARMIKRHYPEVSEKTIRRWAKADRMPVRYFDGPYQVKIPKKPEPTAPKLILPK